MSSTLVTITQLLRKMHSLVFRNVIKVLLKCYLIDLGVSWSINSNCLIDIKREQVECILRIYSAWQCNDFEWP